MGILWGVWAWSGDGSGMEAIWIAVLFPSYWAMKRQYTIPRIGLVRFKKEPRNPESLTRVTATMIISVAVAASLAVWWASTQAAKPFYFYLITDYWRLMLGLLIAASAAAFGRLNYLPRFYAYAALALLLISGSQFTGQPFGVHMLAYGAAVFIYGQILFQRFIRKYPLGEAKEEDA
jgi:hypothetical protein